MYSANKLASFTQQQSRQQIINSILNNSKSKSAWSFSKQKRFNSSQKHCSTKSFFNCDQNFEKQSAKISKINSKTQFVSSFLLKNHSYGFGKSKRKLFTESSQAPLSWKYNPEQLKMKWKNMPFGLSREKCNSGSYINKSQQKIPGPSQYQVKNLQKSLKFTMRPKTGHQRTYFLQNKQAMEIPGPGKYNEQGQPLIGKTLLSKFKDNALGSCGIKSRTKRFTTQPDRRVILSTSLYNKLKTPWSKGCLIGSQKRVSFVQTAQKTVIVPGPGEYQLPSQFGHYKKIDFLEVKKN